MDDETLEERRPKRTMQRWFVKRGVLFAIGAAIVVVLEDQSYLAYLAGWVIAAGVIFMALADPD